jgi:hypothetical protein
VSWSTRRRWLLPVHACTLCVLLGELRRGRARGAQRTTHRVVFSCARAAGALRGGRGRHTRASCRAGGVARARRGCRRAEGCVRHAERVPVCLRLWPFVRARACGASCAARRTGCPTGGACCADAAASAAPPRGLVRQVHKSTDAHKSMHRKSPCDKSIMGMVAAPLARAAPAPSAALPRWPQARVRACSPAARGATPALQKGAFAAGTTSQRVVPSSRATLAPTLALLARAARLCRLRSAPLPRVLAWLLARAAGRVAVLAALAAGAVGPVFLLSSVAARALRLLFPLRSARGCAPPRLLVPPAHGVRAR